MRLIGRSAIILALALLVSGLAWGAMQWTSAGDAGPVLPAGAAGLRVGQNRPAPPDGDFAGREGGPRSHESDHGRGGLFGLVEVGFNFAKIAAIVAVVVVIQRVFARRRRRPAAVA